MKKLFTLLTVVMLLAWPNAMSAADQAKPAAPTLNEVSFPGASYVGKFVFTLPTKTYAVNSSYPVYTLTEELTWYISVVTSGGNYPELARGTGQPGEKITVENVDVRTLYPDRTDYRLEFQINVANSQGYWFARTMKYLGYDSPLQPNNFHAAIDKETNNVQLTWEHEYKGNSSNSDGYIDPEALTYTIRRYPGEPEQWEYGIRYTPVVVAQNVKGTSFLDNISDAPYEGYYYDIQTEHHGHTSTYRAKSDTVKCGRPWTIPYLDTFDQMSSFNRYEANVVYDDVFKSLNRSWTSQNGFIRTQSISSGTEPSDYWLLSPPIVMEEGKLYGASYMARLGGKNTHATITMLLGQGDDPKQFEEIAHEYNVTWKKSIYKWDYFNQSFTVPATGTYRFALHDVTNTENNIYNIIIDSLCIEMLALQEAPDSVTNFSVKRGEKGADEIAVEFDAPTKTVMGKELGAIERIVVKCDDQVKTEFSYNLKGGDHKTFTIKNPGEGYHVVTVSAYNSAGKGLDVKKGVFVGYDQPKPLRDVRLIDLLDGNNGVKLLWTPVDTVGINGGYVNPETARYDIYLNNEKTPLDVPADAIEFVNDSLELVISGINISSGPTSYMWIGVDAITDLGSTGKMYSNNLLGGTPTALPFIEDFTEGNSTYDWWTRLIRSDDPDDNEDQQTYQFGVTPYDGTTVEKGCASWMSGNLNERGQLNSQKITTAGIVHPAMEFSMRWSGSVAPRINIYINKAYQEEVLAWTFYDPEWAPDSKNFIKKVIDLSDVIDGSVPYITFTFECAASRGGTQIYVDNIHIFDLLDYDLATSLETNLKTLKPNFEVPVNVHVKNLGIRNTPDYTVNLKVNGKVVDSMPGEALSMLDEPVYTLHYTPTAADGQYLEMQSEVVYDIDLEQENNVSPVVDLELAPADFAAVPQFTITEDKEHGTLEWQKPEGVTTVTDDFESYAPWIEQVGRWSTIDGDQAVNFCPGTWEMPLDGDTYSWRVFDVREIWSHLGTFDPYAGNKCIVSMSTSLVEWKNPEKIVTDDWLISPLLSGNQQQIEFYVYDYAKTYPSTFEVLSSTTGKNREDFTNVVATYPEGLVPTTWSAKKLRLPEGTKYFAFHCTSSDAFFMALDNITFEAGSGELQGYNVYRDGQLFATVDANTLTLQTDKDEEEHEFVVTAKWAEGESTASNSVTLAAKEKEPEPTAIDFTVNDGSKRVYNLSGQRTNNAKTGINIISAENAKAKKVIVK